VQARGTTTPHRSIRRPIGILTTLITTLIVGLATTGTASAATSANRPADQPRKVDRILTARPDRQQTSADTITFNGGTLTIARSNQTRHDPVFDQCSYQHLCIWDAYGNKYDYFYCGTYNLPAIGNGDYLNDQTPGTTARFLNRDHSVRWTSRAIQPGNADWTPVYYVVPC
jgi:hypothetical protein